MQGVLRKNAKLELLKTVPLFSLCSKKELEEVAQLADEVDLPEGRNLATEGATGKEFVVIVEGGADVRRKGRKINTLGSGDFLGEIALIAGIPRTATVTTTEPSHVLVVTAQAFKQLLRDSPSIQLKVLEALAHRLPPEYD
jgi:CRP/FNR family transcriptional regulator, cyclic AMP receptor protein